MSARAAGIGRRVRVVAGEEFRRAFETRWMFGFTLLLVALVLGLSYFGLAQSREIGFQGFERVTLSLMNLVLFIVPLTGLVLGVASITGSSGLSTEEVNRMQREAEVHAEEDKKAKEAIEIKTNADTLAYQSEKQLKELGDKISGDKKKQVEDAIAAVRDAINRNDVDAMKRTYDDLQTKFQEVSADLYKQASAQAGPRPGPQPGPEAQPRGGAEEGAGKRGEGDVVDAEFEVVDENKKK